MCMNCFLYPFWWHSSEGCLLIWRLCWHHSPGSAATWRLSPRPSSSLPIRCDCSLPFPSIYKLSMSYTYTSSISGQLHVHGYIYLIHRWPCPYNVIMSFSSQLHYSGRVLRVKFEIVQAYVTGSRWKLNCLIQTRSREKICNNKNLCHKVHSSFIMFMLYATENRPNTCTQKILHTFKRIIGCPKYWLIAPNSTKLVSRGNPKVKMNLSRVYL